MSEILHIGKNSLPKYLDELESKGFIKYIADTLHVPQKFFKLFLIDDTYNLLYKTIYDYCLALDVVPPYKDADRHDIGLLVTELLDLPTLLSVLKKRCLKLPKKPSMNYFIQVLTNKRLEAKEPNKIDFEFTL